MLYEKSQSLIGYFMVINLKIMNKCQGVHGRPIRIKMGKLYQWKSNLNKKFYIYLKIAAILKLGMFNIPFTANK